MKFMDEAWLGWVALNLERGCDPEEVLAILLEQKFPIAAIRDAMGKSFPANSSQLKKHQQTD